MPIILSRGRKLICPYHRLEKMVFDVVKSSIFLLCFYCDKNIQFDLNSELSPDKGPSLYLYDNDLCKP